MLTAPGNHPIEWYSARIKWEIELLKLYINDIELIIARSIDDYNLNKETECIASEYIEDESEVIESFKGIDSLDWDLPSIFEEYFPNLQRRSGLITLFSFFENELDRLCDLLQKHDKHSASLSDIKGNGIERSTRYLDKIAGIDLPNPSLEWSELLDIQALRNLVVHANGTLSQTSKDKADKLRRYIKRCKYLSGEDEIIIADGYLSFVLDIVKEYFKKLNIRLMAKFKPKKR